MHNSSLCGTKDHSHNVPTFESVQKFLVDSTRSHCMLSSVHSAELCENVTRAILDTSSLHGELQHIPYNEDTIFLQPDVALFLAAKQNIATRYSEENVRQLTAEYQNYMREHRNRMRPQTSICCDKQCSHVYRNKQFLKDSGCDFEIRYS